MTSRGYRAAKARVPSARALKDQLLVPELVKIHEENYGVYGVHKLWHAMARAGWDIGRDQTYRLMKQPVLLVRIGAVNLLPPGPPQ